MLIRTAKLSVLESGVSLVRSLRSPGWFAAVLACVVVWSLPAVAQVQVTGSVNETTVEVDDVVRYVIQISGAPFSQISNPMPPNATGLKLMHRAPSTSQKMSMVNGVVEQSIEFAWQYRPEDTGVATIRSARVAVAGRGYVTDPISISVVPDGQKPTARGTGASPGSNSSRIADTDVFIRTRASQQDVFQNEQLVLNYVLYFKHGVILRNSRLADSWDTGGFWREDLDVEQQANVRSEIINGLRYHAVTLKRVALFPTRSGELRVEPLRIESEVALPRSSSTLRSLFFDRPSRFQSATVTSPPVNVTTKPLPPPPSGFKGLVGDLALRTVISRREVDAGEPIQLTVVFSGTGNIATLPEPPLELPPLIERFGPEITDAIDRSGGSVRGTKTFVYTLVPRSGGRHSIPGFEVPYFDPATETYKTLEAPSYSINVTGAVVPAASNVPTSRFPIDDIAPPHDEQPSWVDASRSPFYRHSWPYLLLTLPLLGLAALFVYRKQLERVATDERYARNRRAHPAARKHLKDAEELLRLGKGRELYVEISSAVLGFVGDRLGLAPTGMTQSQLRNAMSDLGISAQLAEGTAAIVEECERARFSPEPPNAEMMNDVVDRAAGLIAGIHEEAKQKGLS